MDCNGCKFHPELYYDHEYQIWLRIERDKTLTVGMTDLSQTIAGKILHIRVRHPGTKRILGKPIATIESGKWAGPIPNFINCTIIEANQELLKNPILLNHDPYEAWVVRVSADDGLEKALEIFITGNKAKSGYCKRAQDEDIHCNRGLR